MTLCFYVSVIRMRHGQKFHKEPAEKMNKSIFIVSNNQHGTRIFMSLIFLRKRATEEKDEELLKQFREDGDIEILGQLYERYMHLVYGVCLKYLEDRDTAKDEVMNIFEKLVTAVPEQEILSFKTWLYVVTKNHCLMLLRSRKSEAAHREMMLDDPTFFMEKDTGDASFGKR